MKSIYTKDGLTVHFPANGSYAVEDAIKAMLMTASLAIRNNDTELDRDYCRHISNVIEFAVQMIPNESELDLLFKSSKDGLKENFQQVL